MHYVVSLNMGAPTLDCLSLAVSNLREDISSGELILSEDTEISFLSELGYLEYIIASAEKEIRENA